MRPKDKCPYDIELHRKIWLDAYYKAIHDAMEWLYKASADFVVGNIDKLVLDFENTLINGEEK